MGEITTKYIEKSRIHRVFFMEPSIKKASFPVGVVQFGIG